MLESKCSEYSLAFYTCKENSCVSLAGTSLTNKVHKFFQILENTIYSKRLKLSAVAIHSFLYFSSFFHKIAKIHKFAHFISILV